MDLIELNDKRQMDSKQIGTYIINGNYVLYKNFQKPKYECDKLYQINDICIYILL